MVGPHLWLPEDERLGYSDDGYIRLTFRRFCRLSFAQRVTVRDDDLRADLLARDVPAFSAGYCDWLDVSTPVQISVAWAWFALERDAPPLLAPGGISSNVMITSVDGRELGTAKTDELLRSWLSSQRWQAPRSEAAVPREADRLLLH
ncbi:MAG TPA: DUF4902 domain-containing protein [Rudaea sp.]|nr:DUF4902 domain-containing protein [Rudaea sp.]